MRLSIKSLSIGAVLSILSSSNCVFASAYQIFEQDARSLGTYHAGASAKADDASTVWYNPAGMTNLKKQQFSFGTELINTNIVYNGTQTNIGQTAPSTPQQVNDANGGTFSPVPNFYYVFPYKKWAFGIGVVVPFGAETDYGNGTALRYNGTKTQLQAIDIIPAIAFRATDYLSFGIGADITYVKGQFNNDFAYMNYPDFDNVDIPVTNEGSDWTFGTHIGTLVNINKSNRIGLVYHSKMIANLTGSTKMSGDTSGVTIAGSPTSGYDFSTQIILPAWWDLGYFTQINKNLSLMASVIYTQWNAVDQTVLKNAVTPFFPAFQDITITQDFKSTWNFSVGTTYNLTDQWQIKGGIGYDITPTQEEDRNIQMPDQNRFILATGVEYKPTESLIIALSYAHFFVKDAAINNTQDIAGSTQITNGNVQSSADLVGLQVIWKL